MIIHGTLSGYANGRCRCASCRAANCRYQRAWRCRRDHAAGTDGSRCYERWTRHEDVIVACSSDETAARLLRRSVAAVRRRRARLGITH